MGMCESATGPTVRVLGRCHKNIERGRDGRDNSMGPLEIGEMSWRDPWSRRNTTEATGCVAGSPQDTGRLRVE